MRINRLKDKSEWMKTARALIALFVVAACGPKEKESLNDHIKEQLIPLSVPIVKTEVVEMTDFKKQLVSNGKLSAFERTALSFRQDFKIAKIYKYNGDKVQKGDLLASLESKELAMRFGQGKMQFERSQLDLADALIGLGFDIKDSLEIPEQVFDLAKLRSGYAQAKSDYELSAHDYEHRNLYSPINGTVANMFSKERNYPLAEGPFCSIIDDRRFQVDFPVMESELLLVQKGQKVRVQPYYDAGVEAHGRVRYINPVVDENGLVTVSALVENRQGRLYEGMNVKVFVSQNAGKGLVVSKKAVTRRSGKDVVFTYKAGHAQWNYVTIAEENDERVIIANGLAEGDTVIVEGNIHLAHLAKVEVMGGGLSYNRQN